MTELVKNLPVDQEYEFKDFTTTVIGKDGSERSITINGGKSELDTIDQKMRDLKEKQQREDQILGNRIIYENADTSIL